MKNLLTVCTRGFFCISVGLMVAFPALTQDFVGYEGKRAIREGDGGAKKIVEGVDFWSEGEPPKKYQIIGFINDRRHKTGLFGAISMAGLEKDVASVAKQNGGDAVILMNSESETTGTVGAGNATATGNGAFGFGSSARVQKQNSKFVVVKYLPEVPLTAPPVQTPLEQSSVKPAESAAQ